MSDPNVVLRKGRSEDALEIAEIWHLGWRDGHLGFVPPEVAQIRTAESFRRRASDRAAEMTLAIADGAIAGFVLVVDDEVEQVFVAASHRGTGVADALIREGERQVRANGHSQAWLAVVAGNARARAFYERRGWHNEGPFEYRGYAETGTIEVPSLRYVKQLSAE